MNQPSISKKDATQLWLEQHDSVPFVCIHCGEALHLKQYCVRCENGHQFDSAKQGYYYLASKAQHTKYNQELFQARRAIIRESPLYDALHEQFEENIMDRLAKENKELLILDAGSGESSHLARFADKINRKHYLIGIDLSKEGIQLATDYNGSVFSAVADLTQIPLADDSTDIILSILSPANYEEFHRILNPQGGFVIKVVPNPDYLVEIRQTMTQFLNHSFASYSNQDVIDGFITHYPNAEEIRINNTVSLTSIQKEALIRMTPLTWQLSQEARNILLKHLPNQITVDLTVLLSSYRQ